MAAALARGIPSRRLRNLARNEPDIAQGLRASAPDRSKIVEAARQIKVASRPRPFAAAHGNGRRHPPAKPRRVWDTGNGIDANTAADPFASNRLIAADAANGTRRPRAAGRIAGNGVGGNGVIARLDVAGSNRFA
jgi:hypothetical protein